MKGKPSVVSIADVAQRAGVSPTTVSHALSGKRKVSEGVRTRVLTAMEELQYVPSRLAQNLALGTTRILALVVPDIGNGYFAELAKGVESTAFDRGYNVMLCTTGFDHAREIRYLEMIDSRAVDGIIYAAGAPPTDDELRQLLGSLPLVFVDEEIAGTQFTAVVSDNEEGGRIAAEHLLALGHRSALMISVDGDPVSSTRRSRGFLAAWTAAGGRCEESHDGDFTEHSGELVADHYASALASGEITAVFAHNDLMAVGAINSLRNHGVDVPGAVSVVGFDDIPAVRYSFPALTTIRQDVLALGATATTAIIDSLESTTPLDGRQMRLPVELVPRASTSERRANS
ncbi:MAG: LacI family DNA-binding transcriptional regulator [Rhodoglobus sp.]